MTEAEIIAALRDFIAGEEADEAGFGRMALTVFAYQFAHDEPYRRFALGRGRTPLTVRDWRRIPAVPISAFKELALSCRPPEACPHVFMTSGTTRDVRGRSYHPTLEIYDLSMLRHFRARFMAGRERIRMGLLFPGEEELPNSSLAHYLALAQRECGAPGSAGFIGPAGLDSAGLFAALARAEAEGEPYALLGASYAFVPLLDEMARQGLSFRLPEGSRILDTGGFKGRSREMAADEFYEALSRGFGVPRRLCINMYGMTELSTQLYDDGNESCPPVKSGPHWLRSRVVDPLSGEDVPEGARGVLVHHDLAHFNSVSAILTEDAGIAAPGGFRLLGRADGAESQGCSVAVAEFLRAARG